MDAVLLGQVTINGLVIGFTYTLIALGLAVVYSIGSVLNFAHGGLCVVGGYFLYYLLQRIGLYFPIALLLSGLGACLIAFLIERLLVHRLLGQFTPIIIVMVGLTLVFSGAEIVIFGEQDKTIQTLFPGVQSFLGISLSNEKLVVVGICLALLLGLYLFFQRTKVGQALRAVGQDPIAASIVGIDLAKYSSISFAVGGFLAGVSGGLVGLTFIVSPTMDIFFVLKGLVVIVIGGLGSILGAVYGGILLGIAESFSLTFLGNIAPLVSFAVVILVILFKPTGLVGHE